MKPLADLAGVADRIAARGGLLGKPLEILASTTSTNDLAKAAAKSGAPHGATWVAEEQTAGRGRQGRAWISPRGENLLFSVLLRVGCAPARVPPLAIVVGLAVRDAVARAAPGADVTIKWPNDVLVGGKKVAGVLVEGITMGSRVEAVIVGVGINVHTRNFDPEIEHRATSIALASSRPADRAEVLADVLAGVDRDHDVVLGRGLGLLRARIDAADGLRGKRVRSDAGDVGVAEGIDDEGRLVVRRDDGVIVRWSAGEVHLVAAP